MTRNPYQILFLIGGLSVLTLAVTYFFRNNRRVMQSYYETLENLSKQFPGTLSRASKFLSDVPCFTGQFSGCKFTLTYLRVEGAPPSSLQLKCFSKAKRKLKIFSHSGSSTVLFVERVFVDDPTFSKYNIYSNMPDEAKRYLNNSTQIAAIKNLIEKGWSFPIISTNYIAVSADSNHTVNPEVLKASLEQLISLTR